MTDPQSQALDGFVSVRVADQMFGVPLLRVQDVIAPARIDRAPLAPPEVEGLLNLRGRIITAVDMRRRLGLGPRDPARPHMSVIVERGGELFALQVEDVGDVLWLDGAAREPLPSTLAPEWRGLCDGLYRHDDASLLILDIERTFALGPVQAAA